ncbi:glucokinase [Akanthomyces lecanii RCEF 1005]|uniref:Phosphotransferase n=1 Tax=Akanthomyces lecanii RCEF 1005 TaxID=1081108 RepID=A0A168DWM0_CORDF|nr:glucokinase [Akanthomyces lecanii RCEF 1005]
MAASNTPELGTPKAASFRKLGFTFSFTYDSHSVSHGTMLQWDKGWDIPDAIGRDPCRMLQNAIDRQKLRVRVTALTNDSVGTNAAYVEDRARIEKLPPLKESYRSEDSVMVINTEWGAWFDTTPSALPGCIYDHILDRESPTPGQQLFEKRTSGLYLGELARLVIVDLIASKVLQMTLKLGSPLETAYHVSASFLSLLATSFDEPKARDWQTVKIEISKALHVDNISMKDAQILVQLGAAIVKRAAQLAGATIAAVIIHSERLETIFQRPNPSASSNWRRWRNWATFSTTICCGGRGHRDDNAPALDSDSTLDAAAGYIEIGIDGSLFEYYPGFEEEVRRALRAVPRIGVEGETRVKIGLAKDGSSLGAALIAQSVP